MDAIKLTPATARDLKPGGKLRDHEVKGLQLIAGTTGKSWMLYYRTRNGEERRPRLGRFPEMSLSAARETAKALKQRVAAGEDPSAIWQEERGLPTVAELCDRFLAEWSPKHNAPRTVRENRLMITTHIKPGLGHLRVANVTQTDIDAFLEKVLHREFISEERKKKDRRTRAPSAVNHVRTLLRQLFNLARDYFKFKVQKIDGETVNPTKGTASQITLKRKRLATPAELAAIVDQMKVLATEKPAHAAVLWALFFSGARVSEIERARKDSWRGNKIVLGDHKTVRTIGEKSIEVPAFVAEMINRLDVPENSDRLFGNIAIRVTWCSIREAAQCPDLQLRDARRTFLSYGLDSGYSLDQIGQLVGHTDPKTTRGYAWLLEHRRGEIAERVANQMLSAAGVSRALAPPAKPAVRRRRLRYLRKPLSGRPDLSPPG